MLSGQLDVEWDYAPDRVATGLAYLVATERVIGPLVELALQAVGLASPAAQLVDLRFPTAMAAGQRRTLRATVSADAVRIEAADADEPAAVAPIYLEARILPEPSAGSELRGAPLSASVRAFSAAELRELLPDGWIPEAHADASSARAWLLPDGIEAVLRIPDDWSSYRVHPGVFDCAWLLARFWLAQAGRPGSQLVTVDRIYVIDPGAQVDRVRLIEERSNDATTFSFIAYAGASVACRVDGLRLSESRTSSPLRDGELAALLQGRSEAFRREECALYVARLVAGMTHRDPGELQNDIPFRELGVTSLRATELASALSRALNRHVPVTTLFDFPTIGQLASELSRMGPDNRPVRPQVPRVVPRLDEPIAIIGAGCRFPGNVADLSSFRRLLLERTATFADIPPDRWETANSVDEPWAQRLSALEAIRGFDAGFFGMSPREARAVDPQQRLLLQVAWEALEHAGIPPSKLDAVSTGVFVGASSPEYVELISHVDGYTATGNAHGGAAGRISYYLGLRGPSMVVDTACSSSLAAVHLACQSLRLGESSLAVCGGVNLVLSSRTTTALGRLGALSKIGRCVPFSKDADGYVRGEGCGAVILKPLSSAQRDGDRILAVIVGSAMNHDGRTNGYSAPSKVAQVEVMQGALARAGVCSADVEYLEAHGTGTPLGDAIEIQSISEAYGAERSQTNPLWVGSVKGNIGHLEAAAGMAGLIKSVLVLNERVIFAQATSDEPNGAVSHASPIRVASEEREQSVRYAGVSAFGLSGTNVHVVLRKAPAALITSERPRAAQLLVLSARNQEAVDRQASRFAEWMRSNPEHDAADVCWTAAVHRQSFEYRRSFVARDRAELVAALDANAASASSRPASRVSGRARSLVFVFGGHGSQWLGMGRQLMTQDDVFARALLDCDAALRPHLQYSIADELARDDGRLRLGRVGAVQPAVFAIQVALARLCMAWGLRPAAVIGHSMGEVAAAHIAGALSLQDAAAAVVCRSTALTSIEGKGTMLFVELDAAAAGAITSATLGSVSIATIESSTSCVLSGDRDALTEISTGLTSRGVFWRWVRIECAAHSAQLDFAREHMQRGLASLSPRPCAIPMYSTVTGGRCDSTRLDADYWFRNLREPVQFAPTMKLVAKERHDVAIEIGPHSVLRDSISDAYRQTKVDGAVLGTLERGAPELESLYRTVGALHEIGVEPSWSAVLSPGKLAALPAYPWSDSELWTEQRPQGNSQEIFPNAIEVLAPRSTPKVSLAEVIAVVERQTADVMQVSIEQAVQAESLLQIGFDSLMAQELRSRLWREIGVMVPIGRVFSEPNVKAIARTIIELRDAVEPRRRSGLSDEVRAMIAADAKLDPMIRPRASETADELRAVFLTGATGFLGSHLLDQLLNQTSANVFCLIRADDDAGARARLRHSARVYGLRVPDDSRIIPVLGTLELERFGLSHRAFSELAGQIDLVLNNGALVNFVQNYESLRLANVFGTREGIRLACEAGGKPFHHVSTIAVASTGPAEGVALMSEVSPLPPVEELRSGYAQTKWVAERLVAEAHARGLPVSVLRPGLLIGSASSGAAPPNDAFVAMLATTIQLQSSFGHAGATIAHLTPVDETARVAITLARRCAPRGEIYHLANPRSVRLADIFDWIRTYGCHLRELAYADWWRLAFLGTVQTPLVAFEHMFDPARLDSSVVPEVDCRQTAAALGEIGVSWSDPGEAHIHAMLRHIVPRVMSSAADAAK